MLFYRCICNFQLAHVTNPAATDQAFLYVKTANFDEEEAELEMCM